MKLSQLLVIMILIWSSTNGLCASLPSAGVVQMPGKQFADRSVLASGKWVKGITTENGIHRFSFAFLKSLGFNDPTKLRFFGFQPDPLPQQNSKPASDDLQPLNILAIQSNSGDKAYLVYFPGEGNWIYDTNSGQYRHLLGRNYPKGYTFFIGESTDNTSSAVPGIQISNGSPAAVTTQYDALRWEEQEEINLIGSGSMWFTQLLNGGASSLKRFSIPDRVAGEPILVRVAAAARSESSSTLQISDGSKTQNLNFSPISTAANSLYADYNDQYFAINNQSDPLPVTLQYLGSASSRCWIDKIEVQARCQLIYRGTPLEFSDARTLSAGKNTEYRIANATNQLQVAEITRSLSPTLLSTSFSGGILSFSASGDSLRRFLLYDPNATNYPTVTSFTVVENQNLHALAPAAMLIISASDFSTQAEQLAAYHRTTDQMSVNVVDANLIYNEYGGGIRDITAIRNFVRHQYQKLSVNPLSSAPSLLLFGKGTYDNIHPTSSSNPNLLPTWQSDMSISPTGTYVSDDYLGLLDPEEGGDKGIIDLAVGRIPCQTAAEASAIVKKILNYHTKSDTGSWRSRVTFVGDDEDYNIHVSASEQLATSLNQMDGAYTIKKIYLDSYPAVNAPDKHYPQARTALLNQISEGTLLLNYVGHANELGLAAEKIFTIEDIDPMSNSTKLPVFVTATCEFSRWDDPTLKSAGEHLLFNQTGGAIALFSTTRLVYANSNLAINQSFFNHAFVRNSKGDYPTMGEIILRAKQEQGESVNAAKFALLGDPALRMNYPDQNAVTLELNNRPIELFNDTLKPLNEVKIWGEVHDPTGTKLANFTGVISATLLDKPSLVKTLGNNGQSPFQFQVENPIFNGSASVRGGEFEISLKVPREINYKVGTGAIRYFVSGSGLTGKGICQSLKIGGYPTGVSTDQEGPKIDLYLDNRAFKPGIPVSRTPLLIADLHDPSGINFSGIGIGHDLTLVIDDQYTQPIVLNDYYQSALNTFTSGSIAFSLPMLQDGKHKMTLKGWDLCNNSTEVSLEFTTRSQLTIQRIIIAPNPVITTSELSVEHNRFGEKFSVQMELISPSGVIVDQQKQEVSSNGFETIPIVWNRNNTVAKIPSGVYQLRVRLVATDGSVAIKSTGMVILK